MATAALLLAGYIAASNFHARTGQIRPAAARARGLKLGRQVGQRPSDKKAKRVLSLHADGLSYRLIARNVGLNRNTVMDIVRRNSD